MNNEADGRSDVGPGGGSEATCRRLAFSLVPFMRGGAGQGHASGIESSPVASRVDHPYTGMDERTVGGHRGSLPGPWVADRSEAPP